MTEQNELIEELADLEHDQWIYWSKVLAVTMEAALDNLSNGHTDEAAKILFKKIEGWKTNWKPYSELPNNVKEYDRVWARKVIKLMEPHVERAMDRAAHMDVTKW